MFYYSDLTTELAILVPALNPVQQAASRPFLVEAKELLSTFASLDMSQGGKDTEDSLKSPIEGRPHKSGSASRNEKAKSHNSESETKVVVAWLNDFEDYHHFPALDLIQLACPHPEEYQTSAEASASRVPEKEVVVIFIHAMQTDLYRIRVVTVFGSTIGGPLMDGIVVSRRSLGKMVRNTAINICKRRRLDIDSYSPPHVCRKHRLQEIIRARAQEINIPMFYASLFTDNNQESTA